MEEELIWYGKSSQWVNFGIFCGAVLLMPLFGLGLVLALWGYLDTFNHTYDVTNQRIIEKRGILSRTTDELELYRVKDIKLEQPFLFRFLGLSNIILVTTDRTHRVVAIKGIPNGGKLREKLRIAIEARRDKKRVREIDIE
ncbi:PH domain-containing protein [Nafulsella turpanensis]|uniref:PH domain-containing protein n=1 Tax=Nafulsella turpanensis TaxID=1265690 RepID=UPI0003784B31|nr:PH domain-containing protein [Nafulsella turpanensis]